ncbi:hypothetical protein CCACVL1_30178 [Corchorus capsularis]|uniref:Uncharacterized protein n=1 Tax=Corchorus capsularis TaxID=210143 RepID=A0A1R3FYG2_COCAP|nr:hypothetical protein CCACVL1_30178 [Corchorus capsularis]
MAISNLTTVGIFAGGRSPLQAL